MANRDNKGYGRFHILVDWDASGRTIGFAHRVSWELTNGDIPDETPCVCHKCDNPACVRPDHLFLGTHRDNMIDMWKKGRAGESRGETHGNAKINDAKVRAMRRMYATKMFTQTEIAELFGISQDNVSLIVRSKAWAHVT